MYLDSNGDGVHTAADQVNPSGPTVIDIWLDTDSNRDGTTPVCLSPDPFSAEIFTINQYNFGLSVIGGTVSWGTFTNRQPSMGVNFLRRESDTEFMDGYGGFTDFPPGTYHLATLEMNVASGAPSIQIVPHVSVHSDVTGFGSSCFGLDFDSLLKLGSDWFDADGLPFGTEGTPNRAPLLAQPADMSVSVGETASQQLRATDADNEPLAFFRVSGPSFVSVATVDIGGGSATGKVFLAPLFGDAGPSTVTVGASDRTATDQKSFAVTVASSANHPPTFARLGTVDVVTGTSPRRQLPALDPDGQSLAFSKVAGPDFAEVSTLSSGPGAGTGSLRLTPVLCDAGTSAVTVGVTDGVSSQQATLDVFVHVRSRAVSSPAPYVVPPQTNAVAVGDFNSDGHLDVVAVGGVSNAVISALLGRGDGTLQAAANTAVPGRDPSSVAIGDLNGDGRLDLAVTMRLDVTVTVLTGRGNGTFQQVATLPVSAYPTKVQMADLNGDGNLDLVVANGGGTTVSLFQGNGDATFQARSEVGVGSGPYDLTLGDFNRDGRLDMATATFSSDVLARTVTVRLGFGDGTFADRHEIPLSDGSPYRIATADLNWDGNLDLAVSQYGKGRVAILLGDGSGKFTAGVDVGASSTPQGLAANDFNGDGNLDLLIADPDEVVGLNPFVGIVYGVGDGSFGARRNLGPYPSIAVGTVATGDMNEDGYPDAILGGGGDRLAVWLNDAGGIGAAEARAFLKHGDKALRAGAGGSGACLNLEPVAGSYRNAELNLGSMTLRSEGTGSVSQISPIAPKLSDEKDSDRNGITDLPVCFEQADVTKLFDQIRGRQGVTAHVEGTLLDGRRFCTRVDLLVDGGRRSLAATVTPNPFNPQATLRYSTSGDGYVRVRIFDLSGRLVRTVLDHPLVPAGDHQVIIDGRGRSGEMLASGIYFYQVEALEGTVRGRITILK